ncbi:PqqD family protein [Anaerocolumna sp. AGMB13025]|uniref:PqqD family protein n=1 Tax=Anaerocolumna sp. AGMB13025 TaxID=3039116 RepID=UPI00241EE876|nr:PqqD family protein [Anaerocolumna sp. AGMB13025]WFR54802.1 PqqD family protein [Anaerocolumna sp. AGMB13025]
MHDYVYEVIGKRIPRQKRYKGRIDGKHYLILAEEAGGLITSLNKTSLAVLELCNGQNSIKEITDIMGAKYPGVEKDIIIADTARCICDLKAMNLVLL